MPLPLGARVIRKGTTLAQGYCAFGRSDDPGDALVEGTAGAHLGDVLRGEGVDCVWLMGLALDYCVVTSALSAARQGFEVRVVLPATAAVDGGGRERALRELAAAGVKVVESVDDAVAEMGY